MQFTFTQLKAVAIASVYLLEALDLARPQFGPLVPRIVEVHCQHHHYNAFAP